MIIVSLLFLAVFLVLTAYVVRRRPAVMIAGFFLIFPLVYRSIDIAYLDVFGPVYARQINRFVGGNSAAPMFIYAALSFLIPLLSVFPDTGRSLARLGRTSPPWGVYQRYATTAAFIAMCGAIGILLMNFILVGEIPILQGIDRLTYNDSAGRIHNGAYELNFLLNFTLGAFTVLPRLNGRDYDLRFAGLMVVLLTYWVVTGNRYSAFFVLLSFYFMPVSAVVLASKAGRIPPHALRSFAQRVLTSPVTRVVAGIAALLLLMGLVLNSYFNVRNYREPLIEVQERILVQPVELWSTAWERVDFGNVTQPINKYAVDEIILNPIDPSRNSTIQYLMTEELGYFRSAELAEAGEAYNGGYPEVHFELLGAWLPLLTLPLMGLLAALVLRMCIVLLYRNMPAASIMAVYVYFGVTLHYQGGMVTFPLAPSYWLKIALLVIVYIVERQFSSPRRAATLPAQLRPRVGARKFG